LKRFAFTFVFLFTATAAPAHHSMAMFDSLKNVTYNGAVTQFNYTNPHVFIYVDVEKDGQKVNYRVEANSPYVLKEHGWSASSLQVGEKISITVHPSRDNSNFGLLLELTKANGKKLSSGMRDVDDIPQ